MKNLTENLETLEKLSLTYCVGKVEGEVKNRIVGNGDYYAYAKGTTYLSDSVESAVELAIENLSVNNA